jgi:hypothetical protein
VVSLPFPKRKWGIRLPLGEKSGTDKPVDSMFLMINVCEAEFPQKFPSHSLRNLNIGEEKEI